MALVKDMFLAPKCSQYSITTVSKIRTENEERFTDSKTNMFVIKDHDQKTQKEMNSNR